MKNFIQLKYVQSLFLVLFCALICSTFIACSDDEKDPEEKDFLIGTWKYSWDKDGDEGYIYYIFNEDGTGRMFEFDNGQVEYDESFTYIHFPKESRVKYFIEGYSESVRYEKISDTRIVVFDLNDDVENWVKQ